jgi:rhodanese-related sulfurtransferase
MEQISVIDFSKVQDDINNVLLDVRTQGEFDFVNIGGTHIPLDELENRLSEINKDKTIYCLCHHGVRSEYARQILLGNGFGSVVNISGGIHAWSQYVDTSKPVY